MDFTQKRILPHPLHLPDKLLWIFTFLLLKCLTVYPPGWIEDFANFFKPKGRRDNQTGNDSVNSDSHP